MEDRKRVTASEREALMRINLAMSFLMDEPVHLKNRSKMVKNGAFLLGSARSALERYMDGAYRTIPAEQLMTIRRSIMETAYRVGIKCSATANANRDKEWGVVVPNETINLLFDACSDHCLMCGLDTEGQKKCKLRKALDAIPNDSVDEPDGACQYRKMI